MSRTWKRAVYVHGEGKPWKKRAKRMAAKAVRRFKGWLPEGGWFKRLFCSWEIADYSLDYRFEDPDRLWTEPVVKRRAGQNWVSR